MDNGWQWVPIERDLSCRHRPRKIFSSLIRFSVYCYLPRIASIGTTRRSTLSKWAQICTLKAQQRAETSREAAPRLRLFAASLWRAKAKSENPQGHPQSQKGHADDTPTWVFIVWYPDPWNGTYPSHKNLGVPSSTSEVNYGVSLKPPQWGSVGLGLTSEMLTPPLGEVLWREKDD